MKAEDTLNYNLKKYAGYREFIEVDENYEIPDDLSYMEEFIKTPEARKWLVSLLLNCRNIERVKSILKVRFGSRTLAARIDRTRVIEMLKNIWIMECL